MALFSAPSAHTCVKRSFPAYSAITFFILLSFSLSAQVADRSGIKSHPATEPTSQQELFIPYWTVEPGWHTDLEIRNNISWRDLEVSPFLQLADGRQIALTPVRCIRMR
ncbi:MAG TPA: hypothetical protein VFI95_05180 [Terriglobales bacterium]|nr:hypothetical protein [Terriglobales bacterium]